MQLEHTLVLITRGITRPGNPRVSSHRWFRTRGVSARHHSGRTGRREITPLCVTPFLPPWRPARRANASLHFAHPREAHAPQSHHPALAPLAPILTYVHPVNACPLADKQGRGLASPLKSRTLLSGGHSHGDINRFVIGVDYLRIEHSLLWVIKKISIYS